MAIQAAPEEYIMSLYNDHKYNVIDITALVNNFCETNYTLEEVANIIAKEKGWTVVPKKNGARTRFMRKVLYNPNLDSHAKVEVLKLLVPAAVS